MFSKRSAEEKISVYQQIEIALYHCKWNFVLGSWNKMSDLEKTNGYSHALEYRYLSVNEYTKNQKKGRDNASNLKFDPATRAISFPERDWYYDNSSNAINTAVHLILIHTSAEDPLEDANLNFDDSIKMLFVVAMLTNEMRSGRCSFRSRWLVKYLWEHAEENIVKLEVVQADHFDHVFVIVNREGDLHDVKTWGDAWIVDSWFEDGIIYRPDEFAEKIKVIRDYCYKQEEIYTLREFKAPDKSIKENEMSLSVVTEIDLNKHKFPVATQKKLDKYCLIGNAYPKDWKCNWANFFFEHKQKMAPVLDEIHAVTP